MRIPQGRRPGSRWLRCGRWLGLDRNPLRRRTDRVEAAIRLVTMFVLVVAVPLACIVVGQLAGHLAQRQARDQAAAERQVTAVLLHGVPAGASPDPFSSIQEIMVPARWQLPGQPSRTGPVLAAMGARAGSTETIWVDAAGAPVSAPDSGLVEAAICVAVVNTCLAAGLVLVAGNMLARRALNRWRMREWDAAWRATGPLWSGRRT